MRILVAVALAATALAGTAPLIGQTTSALPASPAVPARAMGFPRADADGDGIVTRAEATVQADAQLDAMDSNRDGKVTGEEMRAAFATRSGGRGMGGRFGADNGGEVSMSRDDFRARALARFDRNDTDHDGKVDQAEVAAARQTRMQRRQESTPQQ